MFMFRFPFLYFIALLFAIYAGIKNVRYQYELAVRDEELEKLGTIDLLTGLMNRNSYNMFEESFTWEAVETLSLAFIDADGLHELNNRRGHSAGDEMLKKIAVILESEFDRTNLYRMGGDEFLVISRDTDEHDMVCKMETVSEKIEESGYSISYGLETGKADNSPLKSISQMVNNADHEMLKAKEAFYRTHERRMT